MAARHACQPLVKLGYPVAPRSGKSPRHSTVPGELHRESLGQRCSNQSSEAKAVLTASSLAAALVSGRVLRRKRRAATVFRRYHPGSEFLGEDAPEPSSQEVAQSSQPTDLDEFDEASYSKLGTHREMLEDKARTEAFRDAIFRTCQDKVVLEVGCGTGILSAFAVQAGARRVIAVEEDPVMASCAREIIQSNGFASVACVLEGRIEELAGVVDAELGSQRVDVLVSEWMGFMLVCEDMFQSVAFARDRWLAEDGIVIPTECKVFLAPFSHPALIERMTGYWGSKPYGVDLSVLALPALDQHLAQPVIDILPSEHVLARPCCIFYLDCRTAPGDAVQQHNVDFDFDLESAGELHGLAAWFTCDLLPGLTFSTGPEATATHWEQTLLFIDPVAEASGMEVQAGDQVSGEFRWLVNGYDMGVAMVGEVQSTAQGRTMSFGRRLTLHVG